MLKKSHSRPEVNHARTAHTATDDSSNRVAVLVLISHMLAQLHFSLAQFCAVRALKRARSCYGSRLALLVLARGSRSAVQQGLMDPSAPPTRTLNGSGKNSRQVVEVVTRRATRALRASLKPSNIYHESAKPLRVFRKCSKQSEHNVWGPLPKTKKKEQPCRSNLRKHSGHREVRKDLGVGPRYFGHLALSRDRPPDTKVDMMNGGQTMGIILSPGPCVQKETR